MCIQIQYSCIIAALSGDGPSIKTFPIIMISYRRMYDRQIQCSCARQAGRQGDSPKKFYPSVVATGKVDQHDAAKMAAEMSTVSPADTAAVIENFLNIVTNVLTRGNIVRLGDFGSFWLRIASDGEATEAEVHKENIESVLPRFTPGNRVQQALDAIEFEKA